MQNSSEEISRSNLAYLESIYKQYKEDPNSLSQEWKDYFEAEHEDGLDVASARNSILAYAKSGNYKFAHTSVASSHSFNISSLVDAYRSVGHTQASLDPLQLNSIVDNPALKLQTHGLSSTDLKNKFVTDISYFEGKPTDLKKVIDVLDTIYCKYVGAEYMHLTNETKRTWIKNYLEKVAGIPDISSAEHKRILYKLTAAEGFEKYLHTAFPGAKRFSVEGGESLIPLLDTIIQKSSSYKLKNIFLGMAHRGRLNALVNVFGKLPQDLFDEFAGKKEVSYGSGDVKYHHGFASTVATNNGEVDISMLCNPSHLAIVSPVVQGFARASQDQCKDPENSLPIVIHGDAAVTAQGVIMETLQLSKTRGYTTGGTIHIVVNNQVGFTTHEPVDVRSTPHCTDVAKMIEAPVFHVNADQPEAVNFIAKLALEYRMTFKEDVFIDLVCYRRLGHNESDDPTITQPLMYKIIRQHQTTRALYAKYLLEKNVIAAGEDKQLQADYRELLKDGTTRPAEIMTPIEYDQAVINDNIDSITYSSISRFASKLTDLPVNFVAQKQVSKMLSDRHKMLTGEMPLDWGCAETLAYASILDANYNIRITGQDVARGTFSHRHAVLFDQETGQAYSPLKSIAQDEYQFNLYNSLLSEEAVLGFEYGYASTRKNNLTIWEAQFGDFANVAQVVIDQFITSGATKWNQHSNLVMLLPHGYEGQGPEHSSARLERFLQLCGEDNIKVCIPTNAAQIFHLLREQALKNTNKPLIVMSPKSLLRHKGASCSLTDLTEGKFYTVLHEPTVSPESIRKVILSTGKIYYDLREQVSEDTTIVRVEQLYPFPSEAIETIINAYPNLAEVVWCQDEPKNQGSWQHARNYLENMLSIVSGVKLIYAGRDTAASPAAGYMKLHLQQQKELLDKACS